MHKTNDPDLIINTAATSEQKSTDREMTAEELEHITAGGFPPGAAAYFWGGYAFGLIGVWWP
jgi:hypothetical protein